MLVVQLTQKLMVNQLTITNELVECSVLEVKKNSWIWNNNRCDTSKWDIKSRG